MTKLPILQVKTTNHDGTARWFREEWHRAGQAHVRGGQTVDEKLWRRNDAGHVNSVLPSGIGEGTLQKKQWSTHIRATPWQLLDLLLCLRRHGSEESRSQQRDNQKAEDAHKRSWCTILVPMRRRPQLSQHRDRTHRPQEKAQRRPKVGMPGLDSYGFAAWGFCPPHHSRLRSS